MHNLLVEVRSTGALSYIFENIPGEFDKKKKEKKEKEMLSDIRVNA